MSRTKELTTEQFLDSYKKLTFKEKASLLITLQAEAKTEGEKIVNEGKVAEHLLAKIQNGEGSK